MTASPRLQWQTSRATCVFAICLVFFAGAIAGAVATNMGAARWMKRSAPFWTEAGKDASLQKWKRDLQLTPEQAQQMADILDDFSMYYRNVLGDGKARILRILNDEQKKKFDKLLIDAQQGK